MLRDMSLLLAVVVGGVTFVAVAVALRVVQPADFWTIRRVTVESLLRRPTG
jgi:hypothetical protein